LATDTVSGRKSLLAGTDLSASMRSVVKVPLLAAVNADITVADELEGIVTE
jgi:hypothetical protein